MAQTTGATSGRALYVALSTTGTTFVDISGHANGVKPGGGERAVGEVFTGDTDTPIVTIGKRAMMELTVNIIYTEVTTEGYTLVKTAYEAGSALYVRWAPKGNTTGNIMFTTAAAYVTNPPYQGVEDVGDGEALMLEASFSTASVTQAAVT